VNPAVVLRFYSSGRRWEVAVEEAPFITLDHPQKTTVPIDKIASIILPERFSVLLRTF
jgi:hypothetical protein